jgi:hypothetical protein
MRGSVDFGGSWRHVGLLISAHANIWRGYTDLAKDSGHIPAYRQDSISCLVVHHDDRCEQATAEDGR